MHFWKGCRSMERARFVTDNRREPENFRLIFESKACSRRVVIDGLGAVV